MSSRSPASNTSSFWRPSTTSATPTTTVRPYDVVSADDLIAGYVQMAERAHTHGIKVYVATLTPYVGAKLRLARRRAGPPGPQPVDPHHQPDRRLHRLRQGHPGPRQPSHVSCPPSTTATTSTPAIPDTRPWATPSTSSSSSRSNNRPHEAKERGRGQHSGRAPLFCKLVRS